MATDKIERLLETFSPAESRRLLLFFESPYFSIPPIQRNFGRAYLTARSLQSWQKASKEAKWTRVYPDLPFDDGHWRKQKTFLQHWVEQFLLIESQQKEWTPLTRGVTLLEIFHRRGLEAEFESLIGDLVALNEVVVPDGEQVILAQGKLLEIAYNHFVIQENPHKDEQDQARLLKLRLDAFEKYVNLEYLMMANAIEQRRKMRRTNEYLLLPPNFANFLNENRNEGSPLIRCHILLHDVLTREDEDSLLLFVQEFREILPQIHRADAQLLFDHTISLLVRAYLRQPTREMEQYVFSLYESALKTKIFTTGGERLPLQHFKNICTLGCRLELFGFVSNFIETVSPELPSTNEARSVAGYCRALLQNAQGDHRMCLETLRQLDYERYMKLEIRALEIKAWCEIGEWQFAESRIENFERYLTRSRIPNPRKDALLNRLRLTRKVIHCDGTDRREKHELEKQLNQLPVLDAGWLISVLAKKTDARP